VRLRNYSKTSAQVLPGIGYDVSRGEAERTPYSKLLYAKLLNAEKYSEKLEPTVNFMPFLMTLLAILVNNASLTQRIPNIYLYSGIMNRSIYCSFKRKCKTFSKCLNVYLERSAAVLSMLMSTSGESISMCEFAQSEDTSNICCRLFR